MRKISIAIIVLLVYMAGYSQTIDEFIQEQMEINHVPGLSACIIIDDSVYWNSNYGYQRIWDSIPVNDSTTFNVFSIGKTITTACNMQLWDKQILGLDQNINDFIPFQVENPYTQIDSITPRMMMTHTSTINDWNFNGFVSAGDPTESLASFVENYLSPGGDYYADANYYNEIPGTNFNYDNYGIAMLGYLVEALTGIEFKTYAKDSLLKPMDIQYSAWYLADLDVNNLAKGYTYSGGTYVQNTNRGHPAYPGLSLRASALDLANFDIMLLGSGMYKGLSILSESAIDSMKRVQNPSWFTIYGTTGLGMFVREDLGDRVVWGHNGGGTSGYAAHMYFCEEENSGVVITTNSEQYLPELVEYLFDHALSITTAIGEQRAFEKFNLKIYPNPANNSMQISIDDGLIIDEVLIFNQIGQLLHQGKYRGKSIDISALSPGLYILEARMKKGLVREKFIKR